MVSKVHTGMLKLVTTSKHHSFYETLVVSSKKYKKGVPIGAPFLCPDVTARNKLTVVQYYIPYGVYEGFYIYLFSIASLKLNEPANLLCRRPYADG